MSAQRRAGASPALRALHSLVFLGLCAAAFAGCWPEWLQLWRSQRAPFHYGEPPRALMLLASAACAVGAAGILLQLARRRPVPLPLSGAVLFGFGAALVGLAQPAPEGRSWAAADLEVLKAARALHARMVTVLQDAGQAPAEPAAWEAALAELSPGPSPARDKTLQRRPYAIVWRMGEAPPGPLVPGQLHVRVAAQGASFELRAVGFDPGGAVALLTDDKGVELVLRGAYNPDKSGANAQR